MSTSSRALLGAFALAVTVATVLLVQCGSESDTGPIQVRLTDAPFPFELLTAAPVVIDRVEAHIIAEETRRTGFHLLSAEEDTVDLLDLQNGVSHLLADTEVPVGHITQIRLHVVDASVTLTDGRTFDLDIPSGEQSGIKIHVQPHIEVVGSLTTDVLLDFDVSRSFHPIPATARAASEITEFFFRPSVRAANLTDSGSISGRVVTAAEGGKGEGGDFPVPSAAVTATRNGEEVASTGSDDEGRFKLEGLPPGSYTLIATATGYVAASQVASVTAGDATEGIVIRLARE
jgi:hypothetical protein